MRDFPAGSRWQLADPAGRRQELIDKVTAMTGLEVSPVQHLTTIKHGKRGSGSRSKRNLADSRFWRTRAISCSDIRWY